MEWFVKFRRVGCGSLARAACATLFDLARNESARMTNPQANNFVSGPNAYVSLGAQAGAADFIVGTAGVADDIRTFSGNDYVAADTHLAPKAFA